MAEKQIIWKQEKGNRNTRQWWLRALLISVLQLLLVWGTNQLANNVFGVQEVTDSARFWLCMLLFTVIISLWNEWSLMAAQRKKKLTGSAILLVGLAVGLWIAYGGAVEELADGFRALGNTYVNRWNAHNRDYRVGSSGATVLQTVVELLLLIVMPLVQILGGLVKKRRIVLVVPISVIGLGLVVVAIPQWSALAALLMSGVFLFYLDSSDSFAWKRLGILTAGVLLFVTVAGVFQENAQEQMRLLNVEWFDFWGKLGKNFEQFSEIEIPEWSTDRDVIDNTPPEYKDQQVILLTMSEQVTGPVYLRGYHCKDYVDGAWEKDTQAFFEACEAYGISEDEATESLILYQHAQEDMFDNEPVEFHLSYTGIKNEYCYFPYGVGWEEGSSEYELSQDYLIKKERNDREETVTGWQQLYHREPDVDVSQRYSSLQEWYDEFVSENYLNVPDSQKAVKKLASEMRQDVQIAEYLVYLSEGQSDFYEEINAARLNVAYLVARWLKSQGTYSLELDELPDGTDAVEYFLATSGEGFCEHFASAGTLILRELGVPARYTTGYITRSGTTVSVLDSAAHAWTEIYLDNYGWVPIEMTPGYSGNSDTMLAPNPTATPEVEDLNQPEEMEPEDEESPTEAPTQAPTNMPIGTSKDTAVSGDGGGANHQGTSKLLPAIVLLGVVAGVGFAGYYHSVIRKGRRRNRLAGYLRRGENRKAVKWINAAIYKQLVHKERKFHRASDRAFLAALKSEFPEVEETRWDAYFEVVRRAAYSLNKISAEEAEECYALYKVVQESGQRK